METNESQERPSYIKRIEIIGIFNRFDIILDDLQPGINILHGDNGSGKTTVLHILINALNGDYGRFLVIDFNRIKIIFDNDSFIQIRRPSGKDLILKGSNFSRELELSDGINEPDNNQAKEDNNQTKEYKIVQERIDKANERVSRFNVPLKAAYFPAFRSAIEAWNLPTSDEVGDQASLLDLDDSKDWQKNVNFQLRKLFGTFVPNLNYLSPFQIEKEIFTIFKEAKKEVLYNNQEVLSKNFRSVLTSFSNSQIDNVEAVSQNIIEQIKQLSKEITKHPLQGKIDFIEGLEEEVDKIFSATKSDENLSVNFAINTLSIYRESLQKIVNFQNKLFEPISDYLQLVNETINRKKIVINLDATTDSNFLNLQHLDGTRVGGIQYLSSGERQIFTLIYAVTHIDLRDVILIDEPEISIHINTQIQLLKSLSELLSGKQVIVCTHSPTIAGEQIDRLREVKLLETDVGKWDKALYQPPSAEPSSEELSYASEDEDFGAFTANEVIGDKE